MPLHFSFPVSNVYIVYNYKSGIHKSFLSQPPFHDSSAEIAIFGGKKCQHIISVL